MRTLLLMLALTATATAAPRLVDLARVLGGYERTANADDIRALGPEADRMLIDHAEAPNQTRIQRQRAIVALRFVPTSRARSYALALLSASASAEDGPQAIDAASAITALSVYPDALTVILPHLAHASAEVRHSAAAALGVMRARESIGPLQTRLSIERDPGVRLVLQRSLKQLRD